MSVKQNKHPAASVSRSAPLAGAAAILAALALAASGCNRASQGAPPTAPPEVIVEKPVPGTITDFEEFTGHTEAVKSVMVQAMVTGYLDKVNFKEGDDVAEDAPLFKIDPRIYQAQLDQAKANLALAQAHLKRLEADLLRAKSLLPTKAIAQADYDKAEGDRNEAAAAVKVAEASVHGAQQNVDFTTITASIPGRISRQMIDPGNMVKANETPLTRIVNLDKMYIIFDVDERTSPLIRGLVAEAHTAAAKGDAAKGGAKTAAGRHVEIEYGLADEDGFPHKAAIDFVDNQIDSATGTLRLRAVVDNMDKRDGPDKSGRPILLPYTFLRVRVPIGLPHDTLFVPEMALGSDQGQKFLYLVDGEKKAVRQKVTCGPLVGDKRAITDGLNPTDIVVVSGLQRIRAGDKVAPKESKPEKPTDATAKATAAPTPTAAPRAGPKPSAAVDKRS